MLIAAALTATAAVFPSVATVAGVVALSVVTAIIVLALAMGAVLGLCWLLIRLATLVGRFGRRPVAALGRLLRDAGRILAAGARVVARLLARAGGAVGRLLSDAGRITRMLLRPVGRVIVGVALALGAVGRVVRATLLATGREITRLLTPPARLTQIAVVGLGRTIGAIAVALGRWTRPFWRTLGRAVTTGATGARRLAAFVANETGIAVRPLVGALARCFAGIGRAVAFIWAPIDAVVVRTFRRLAHGIGVAVVKARLETQATAMAPLYDVPAPSAPTHTEVPFLTAVEQNEFLFRGGTEVDAVVTVESQASDDGGADTPADAAVVVLLDCSGSMGHPWAKLRAARQATAAAIDVLRDGTWFAIVRANDATDVVFPPGGGLAPATDATRAAAKSFLRLLWPEGGTAMGEWLLTARELLDRRPSSIAQVILLTDGRNESESAAVLEAALRACDGRFQCDCRGVGTDWDVDELRTIASRTLGSVDIVARPSDLEADFVAMTEAAMTKRVGRATLRVWTPRGARLRFLHQVAPEVVDLTPRRRRVDDHTVEFVIGAWGAESRDYHLCVDVPPRAIGEEMLAARVTVVVDGRTASTCRVRAIWTADEDVASRVAPSVALATGQVELSTCIQDGLAARRAGDEHTATERLGRAVAVATANGNDQTLKLLESVVVVEHASRGTVRLRPTVDAVDEMALDARSTRTVRRA